MTQRVESRRAGAHATDESRKAYYERIGAEHLAPLWTFFHDWFGSAPKTASVPHVWRYDDLRPLVLESGALISAEEAERRVLALENPGLVGQRLVTESLYAGIQLILPGETAPPHRHSPAALRFILEGSGAYTAVNGRKAHMEPGDFIVTPSWTWHEHGHDGDGPTVWMDVLDVPLVRLLGTTFIEHYPAEHFPASASAEDSLYRYGMNMMPVDYHPSAASAGSPIFSYPYARSRDVLDTLRRKTDWDRCHGLKMEFTDPTSGGPAIPTISTFLQLVPAGFRTAPYRSTDSKVLCVIEGHGTVTLGEGSRLRHDAYRPRDICALPSWQPLTIAAEEDTVIFSASDRAVQHKVGLWRERRDADAGPVEPRG